MGKTVPTSKFDLMINWLISKVEKEKEAAISILSSTGQPAVALLISAALKPRRSSQHLIAILDVIREIGGPLGFLEMTSLQSLLRHHDPSVRAKVEQVILGASSCGTPDTPEGVAVMRAFNPFLQTPPNQSPRRTQFSDILAAMRGDAAAIQRRARHNAAGRRREEERENRRRS